MITLVHTGMQVPTERIRVTSLDQTDLGHGIAWSAVLRDGTTKLGLATNNGHGGPTRFHPSTRTAQRRLDAFVAQCRSRDGEPLDEDTVIDTLTDEYEYAKDVAQAERRRAYLVRTFDHSDIPDVHWLTARGGPLDYEAALAAAPRLALGPRTARAELWMGDRGWVEFYRSKNNP